MVGAHQESLEAKHKLNRQQALDLRRWLPQPPVPIFIGLHFGCVHQAPNVSVEADHGVDKAHDLPEQAVSAHPESDPRILRRQSPR